MVGDLEAVSVRATTELDAMGVSGQARGTAVDLGAGFGLQPCRSRGAAIPLPQSTVARGCWMSCSGERRECR
jgi:hypothetical protein